MKTTVDEPEPGLPAPDDVQAPLVAVEHLAQDLRRALMVYKFGIDEMMTKINILREEFTYAREYNPIEHVKSRLKSPESILAKAERKGAPASLGGIREAVRDIAGIRITCSFTSDVYQIIDMITSQLDVTVVEIEDYIARPKPNGTAACTSSFRFRCTCPTGSSASTSNCRSAPSPWTSGRAWSTRSTTSTTARFRTNCARNSASPRRRRAIWTCGWKHCTAASTARTTGTDRGTQRRVKARNAVSHQRCCEPTIGVAYPSPFPLLARNLLRDA